MQNHKFLMLIKTYISIFGKIFSLILPPLFSIAILGIIKFLIQPNNYIFIILAIILLIPVSILTLKIKNILLSYSLMTDNIIRVLESEMIKQSEEIKTRPGRNYPDTPMVNHKNYLRAIISIRTNGFLEFPCQKMGFRLDKNQKEIYLFTITPGMMQFFMILTPELSTTNSGYLRIYEPDGFESRDYTETWFNHIFPILGNFTDSISEKMNNPGENGEFSQEFYSITNFKVLKSYRAGKKLSRFRIYL